MSVYLFGCDGSYLRQAGSSIVAHRLSSCDTRTPEPTGSVAGNPRASSRISSLTSDHTCVPPCIARCILYRWTTREVPLNAVLVVSSHSGGSREDMGKVGGKEEIKRQLRNRNCRSLLITSW